MKSFTIGVVAAMCLSTVSIAKQATKVKPEFTPPTVEAPTLLKEDGDFVKGLKAAWTAAEKKTGKRKVASEIEFQESNLSDAFKNFRSKWLAVKDAEGLQQLLNESYNELNLPNSTLAKSPDMKYFLPHLHVMIPLRGIIWKMRPLFETGRFFSGSKATHAMAVQFVRNVVTGIKMFMPTDQWDAGIEFLVTPTKKMKLDSQFKTVAQLQDYLQKYVLPYIENSAQSVQGNLSENPESIYVWDNQITFGVANFSGQARQFVGYGPAEQAFSIAMLYQAAHDLRVFNSFNQDALLWIAKELGKNYGIDAAASLGAFGITDRERNKVVAEAVSKKHWLEIATTGKQNMKYALIDLNNAVILSKQAYDYLQGKPGNSTFAINPARYQESNTPLLKTGVSNMVAVVNGRATIKDSVTGETVTLDVPAYYNDPPESLFTLSANDWEEGSIELTMQNEDKETLKYRNYSVGRSISWDNAAWEKYVPSAAGKEKDYMAKARLIMRRSLGTAFVFGAPDIFVR